MRHLVPALVAILLAGCGSEEPVGRTEPAAPPPAPAPAPASAPTPVQAATPAPAPAPKPAAGLAPLIDPASPTVLAQVAAAGQADAKAAIEDGALAFTIAAGNAWPGLAIRPAGGAWNLAEAGGIEAVIENAGAIQAQVGLRVDEQGGTSDAWNGEQMRLAPGATGTVRVAFGTSWGKPGYKLDPAKVGRVLLYIGSPTEDIRLRLRALKPVAKSAVKQGGPPAAIPLVRKPVDPRFLSFAAGIDAARIKASGATVATGEGGAAITLGAAQAEVVFRPAVPFDLRDFREAAFAVRNPGAAPVRVRCRLEGSQSDQAAAAAEIPAGGRVEVVVPFGSGTPWRGVTPGTKPAAASDKPFLGAADERSSTGLVSDQVVVAALSVEGAAGAAVVWEGVTAATGAPAVLPSWIGTRPPVDGDWQRILDEDFDGTALDTTRWTPRLPWVGPIPWELQCYSDKNVSVADGHLVIRCEKRPVHLYENPAWPKREYATGAVTSYPNWRFRYGYAETRMKLPTAIGLWPAFWTMPDRGPEAGDKNKRRSTDVDGMEIDIFEHPNRFGPFRYNVACHWDGYGPAHKSTGSSRIYGQPDAEGYIIAGFLWEEGRIAWYCNGVEVGRWEDPRVASVPMSLKYTVQMGGWAGNEVEDAKLPQDFTIDWVRVWQRKAK